MRNAWIIATREYRQYFLSPVAYIVAFLILLFAGVLFVLDMYIVQQQTLAAYYAVTPPGVADIVIFPTAFLLLFAAPALTMRLLSEEHRAGTLELLLTSPLKDWELIFGKWLGSFLYLLTVYAVTLILPIVLNNFVSPGIDLGVMAAGYLGLILLTAAYLAIGTAISSFFNNQFASFFATLVVLLVLWWVISWPAGILPYNAAEFLRSLDTSTHIDSMMGGVITLDGLVYYLSLTSLGLFLGTIAIEIRRWR
ncbi:MAG: ABC transporter permease subunit [Anaerolineales bacterium]|nr:ABC transporter permease subunit [Anaerolineales bacterium]